MPTLTRSTVASALLIMIGALIWIVAATSDSVFNGGDLLGLLLLIAGVVLAVRRG